MDRDRESNRNISFKDLGRFTVNDKGQVCLDGKPIEVQRVKLTEWQARIGAAGALAVIAQAVVYILQTFQVIP